MLKFRHRLTDMHIMVHFLMKMTPSCHCPGYGPAYVSGVDKINHNTNAFAFPKAQIFQVITYSSQ